MKINKPLLIGLILANSILTPLKAKAQTAYGIPYDNLIKPGSTESTFSIHTGQMSCTSGGGTSPSLYMGLNSGLSDINNIASNYHSQSDEFISGSIGFNIPLSSPSNKTANCVEVLAIVEAEEFLSMMEKMKALGVLDDERSFAMTLKYMKIVGDKLGIDLEESLLKPDRFLQRLRDSKK